jgi:hypothetical protein
VRLAVADDGHLAVGGPQVNANNRFSHDENVSFLSRLGFQPDRTD